MQGAGNTSRCGVCGDRLIKNGRTSAGTQRWICPTCRASSTRKRPDLVRARQLDRFLGWLTSSKTQHEQPGTARTFRRQHAWCWNIEPAIAVTGQIYDQVQVDGIYLSSGWCALIAIAQGHVIAIQWTDTEKSASWTALLTRLPPPVVVICDGGPGLASALRTNWPATAVQRCLVHVQRNIRTHLSTRPRTDAGRTLWALTRSLTSITTPEQATAWQVRLHQWHQVYGHLTWQKTYPSTRNPRPAWASTHAPWWWTHERLRRAYRLLARLTKQGVLFTHLDPRFADLNIAATTNQIEGGVNAQLRDLLRRHRGMSPEHQRRAIEWWCYLHSPTPKPPTALIRPEHYQPTPPAPTTDEPIGPATYDTATNAEEGLWTRQGWAGRSHRHTRTIHTF